jgi:hypothetical protein
MPMVKTHGSECSWEEDERDPCDYSHVRTVSTRKGRNECVQFRVTSCELCEVDVGLAISLRDKAVNLYMYSEFG